MSEETDTTKLARLLLGHPDLPVRVCVSSDLYNGENENYDVGGIAWSAVEKEYMGKEYLHYKSNADYEEALADACGKGDLPYKPPFILGALRTRNLSGCITHCRGKSAFWYVWSD